MSDEISIGGGLRPATLADLARIRAREEGAELARAAILKHLGQTKFFDDLCRLVLLIPGLSLEQLLKGDAK